MIGFLSLKMIKNPILKNFNKKVSINDNSFLDFLT